MRRRVVVSVAAGAAAVALAAGAWGIGWATGAPSSGAAAASAGSAARQSGDASGRAEPSRSVPTPTVAPAALRTCSIAKAAKDPRLHSFSGSVLNARTGEALFSRAGAKPKRTASVLKILTSAAALKVLGPDWRLSTTVVAGAKRGQVVLVGGGDPTLTRATDGPTFYPGAPHLSTLADRVKRAWAEDPVHRGQPITQVLLDASYFGGPTYLPSWSDSERTDGYMPKITALMVDGDRDDPAASVSPRGDDPVQRAGTAFARLLGKSVTTRVGTAPPGALVLAAVRSERVSALVKQSLMVSDNALAEALARVTAIEAHSGNRFADLQAGMLHGLKGYGVPTDGIVIKDGSGLSPDDAVSPEYLSQLLVKVLQREGQLGVLYDGLPVAGTSGSLAYADRFQDEAARARGHVHAKTGWIDDGYSLAGIIDAKDGTPLTFAFTALGDVSESAKPALDELTADAWACGNRLSNR